MRIRTVRISTWKCRLYLFAFLFSSNEVLADPIQSPPTSKSPTASPSSSGVVTVTWPEVVRLVDKHPRIAAALSRVDVARSGVDVVRTVPNPILEASVGHGRAQAGNGARVEWGLALTMPLSWLAQRSSRVRGAEAEVDVSLAEGKALRRDTLLQLATLFWGLAHEQARVLSLETIAAQGAMLVLTVQKRVDKGEARPLEATRVEIELEKLKNELDAARTSLGAGQEQLSQWLALPRGSNLRVVADLENLPALMPRERALATAISHYPILAAHRARVRALDAEVRTEQLARVPSVALTGFTAHELDRRAYGIGVGVDVPLWNWNSGRIAQAQAKLAAEQKQSQAAILEISSEVVEASAACEISVTTATRLRDNVLPRSETAASTMVRMYQLGEANLLEVIDARRTLLESHRLYLDALTQAHTQCNRLSTLVGVEPS